MAFSYELDYALLALAVDLSDTDVSPVSIARSPPFSASLLHYPCGKFEQTDGTLLQCNHLQLKWPVLLVTNIISSGGGYINYHGDLCAIHRAVYEMGYSPVREAIPVFLIQEDVCARFGLSVSTPWSRRDHKLYLDVVPVNTIPNPLGPRTAEELRIPCWPVGPIPGLSQFELTQAVKKYFVLCVAQADVGWFMNEKSKSITLISLGPSGVFTTKRMYDGGVRIDFQGVTSPDRSGYKYFNYQAQLNDGHGLPRAKEYHKVPSNGGTTIAHVEIRTDLVVFPSASEDPKNHAKAAFLVHLRRRMAYGLLQSFKERLTYRVAP